MTLRPLRFAHLADTHLGYHALNRVDSDSGRNQRAVDIERAFDAAIDRILAERVDLVIHAGDVFHHTRPSWSALQCFVRQMRRIEAAGIPCLVIGGNHDTPRLRTTDSAFNFLQLFLPRIHFVTGYETDEWRLDEFDLTLHAVPHGALTNPDPPFVMPQRGRRNVLVTHGLAPGVELKGQHEPGEETLSGALLGAAHSYIALGHFHIAGDQGHNAFYSGSTERIGWGDEAVRPGLLFVTLGDLDQPPEVEIAPIATRPMTTLNPIDGEDRPARELADVILDRVDAVALPEAMIRVELRHTPRPLRREVESILRREVGERAWSLQVYAKTDLLARFQGEVDGAHQADLHEMFTDFVDDQLANQTYDAVFAAAFRARGQRALSEAMHQAQLSSSAEDSAA